MSRVPVSELWVCGEEEEVNDVAARFQAEGWQLAERDRLCCRLTASAPCGPSVASIVREHPAVTVVGAIYDVGKDRQRIVAGTRFVYAQAEEDMHMFSHPEFYEIPTDATIFDY
jgi:hypothetical protein